MEWLASMQIVNNMSSVFSFLTKFADLDNAPMVGIDYSNLYVVNSIKTFDIISINIKEFGSGLYSVQIKEEEKVLLEREIEID